MLRRLSAVPVAVLLLSCAVLPAVAAEQIGAGAMELQLGSSFNHTSYSYKGEGGLSTTNLTLGATVGYFLNDRFELGGGIAVVHQSLDIEGEGSSSLTTSGLTGDLTFNFPSSSNVVPFVGLSVGGLFYSGDGLSDTETTWILPALTGGIRVMVGNSASMNFGVGYAHQSNALGAKDVNGNQFNVNAGMSIFPIRHK